MLETACGETIKSSNKDGHFKKYVLKIENTQLTQQPHHRLYQLLQDLH